MIPVRCFTCLKVLGHLEKKWKSLQLHMSPEKALDALGLKRECCRSNMITFIDVNEQLLDFERTIQVLAPDDTSSEHVKIYSRACSELKKRLNQ